MVPCQIGCNPDSRWSSFLSDFLTLSGSSKVDTGDGAKRQGEMGSAPLFCLERLRPDFLINKTLIRVSLAVCCAGRLFKLPGTITHSGWNRWNCCPRSMQMRKGHYQQQNLDQEVISGQEEEVNSIWGMKNPPEDSLGTPCCFQESSSLNIQNAKNYFEVSISYDQATLDLIWEHGENILRW